jgi:murein DD-endopeptidase MepM/ murein hydrolase activator NlpD
MGKRRYTYNPETCRYEPYYLRGKKLALKVSAFILLSFSVASAGYFYVHSYFETVDELLLEQKHQALQVEWEILEQRVSRSYEKLATFIDKDDNNYRVILDSPPLSASIREAGVGGSERINYQLIKDYPKILRQHVKIEKLNHQLEVEVQSYKEINKMLDHKISVWASRPAIQPLSNWDLTYLHTTYGRRLHPILGFERDHNGLDFTAEDGTPVYATGDGVIRNAYFSESLGKVIFLDHRYGYETRYAHLSKFNVGIGQSVKRGEVIGYVGSTGLSGGAHLHYEVLYEGQHINPINFFQRDLNNREYEKLIEIASSGEQPLDNH